MTATVQADSPGSRAVSVGDYSAYRERVMRPLRRRFRTLNAHDFDDIWQDAQIKVYTREASGERIDNLAGLLWQVALFEALSALKRYTRRSDQTRLDNGYEQMLAAGGGSSPSTLLEAGTLAESIRETLERLPERRRQVVLLRFVEEISPRQIASLLGILERTVHREIGKAIDGIAQGITEHWQAVTLDRKRVAELVAYTVDTLPQSRRARLEREFSDSPELTGALHDLRAATRAAAAAVPLPLIPLPGSDRAGLLERLVHLLGGGGDAIAPTVAGGGATAAGSGIFATLGGKVAAICVGGACVAAVTAVPVVTSRDGERHSGVKAVPTPIISSTSAPGRQRRSEQTKTTRLQFTDRKQRRIATPLRASIAQAPVLTSRRATRKTGEFDLSP